MLRTGTLVLLLALTAAIAWAGERGTLLGVNSQTGAGEKGEAPLISITSEGGFRWSKTDRFSVQTAAGKHTLTVERIPYEGQKQGPVNKPLTGPEHADLKNVLQSSAALTLKDDMSLKGEATDMPLYEVTVNLDGKTNKFRVYGPQLLKTDPRYMAITDAVEALADKYSPAPQL